MNAEPLTAPLADELRQDELEAQGSRLLREHSQRYITVEYPFYANSSLRQFRQREEKLTRRELRPYEPGINRVTSVLDAMCERSGVTDVNRVLLDLACQGLTAAEIGEELELSAKAVRTRLTRIVRRLQHLAQDSKNLPKLIAKTHQEQLHPQRYHPEQHCDAGREACRKDGRCKFRWYLYHITSGDETE